MLMALLALAGLLGMALDRPARRANMEIWLFARMHKTILCDGNPSLAEQYFQSTGKTLSVESMVIQALDVRLLSMFMSKAKSDELPDAVEIEINSVGKYFRPPVQDVGFYPLNDLIAQLPPSEKLLASRLGPWTKDGVIFGVPHDVNPVAIIYRKDLFDAAGVDLASAQTWPQFQNLCLAAQTFWSAHDHSEYRAMELRRSRADDLIMMLMQQHINVMDDRNQVHIADPGVARTIAFYAQMCAGPRNMSAEPPAADVMWTQAMKDGRECAALCPDWRIAELKSYTPELAGNLALMPLPKFSPTDAPTATWGGTMIAIPKSAKDPLASWRMIQFLYLSPPAIAARRMYTDILPATPAAWNDPTYHEPDPFFAGQKAEELYINLARQLPVRYVTPFSLLAEEELGDVLNTAIKQMAQSGPDHLQQDVQTWLQAASADLQKRVNFGKFEN